MPNFKGGKIYKLVSNNTNKIYIGSTTLSLKDRLSRHKANYKMNKSYISSRHILQFDDVNIVLIEEYPCSSKKELLEREQYHQDENKNICVNNRRAIRDREAKIAYDKEYQNKHYDKHIQAVKKYNEKNKEKINARCREKVLCIYCDKYGRKGNISTHHKSKSHLEAVTFFNNLFK